MKMKIRTVRFDSGLSNIPDKVIEYWAPFLHSIFSNMRLGVDLSRSNLIWQAWVDDGYLKEWFETYKCKDVW